MTPAFLRYAIVLIAAAGMSVLSAPVGTFGGQEHECPVPERFYTSEPLLTKTAKALTGGQEVLIAVLGGASTVGLAAGGARPRVARAVVLSARREIPIRAHQSRQPCRGTPDGEGGGRAPGSRRFAPEANPCYLGDRHDGGGSRNRRRRVPGDSAGRH